MDKWHAISPLVGDIFGGSYREGKDYGWFRAG